MSWSSVGSVEVGPQDREVLVGSFSMEEGDDTLWFRVTQTSPKDVWNYSYGLLTWRTSFGKELGTVKVYGDKDSEVFRLGIGLPPLDRTGSVFFQARSYNRRWIETDEPPIWSLTFEAQSGVYLNPPSVPVFGVRAPLGVLADLADSGVTYAITDGVARIVLSS